MKDWLQPDENPRTWLADTRLHGRGSAAIRSIVSQILGHPKYLYVNRRTLEARAHEAEYDLSKDPAVFRVGRDSPMLIGSEVRARLEAILGSEYEVSVRPLDNRSKSFILICKLRKKG